MRKRGRPRLDQGGSSVSTWMPDADHDRLIALARQRRCSVSALVYGAVIVLLDKSGGPKTLLG